MDLNLGAHECSQDCQDLACSVDCLKLLWHQALYRGVRSYPQFWGAATGSEMFQEGERAAGLCAWVCVCLCSPCDTDFQLPLLVWGLADTTPDLAGAWPARVRVTQGDIISPVTQLIGTGFVRCGAQGC